MVFRSCLCHKEYYLLKTPSLILMRHNHTMMKLPLFLHSFKYPGFPRYSLHRFYSTIPDSTDMKDLLLKMRRTVNIPQSVSLHPALTTRNSNDQLINELRQVLQQKNNVHKANKLYTRLSLLPSNDIYNIFTTVLDDIGDDGFPSVKGTLTRACTYWNHDVFKDIIKYGSEKYVLWRVELLKMILSDYMNTRDINQLMNYLPVSGDSYHVLPFYNAVLSACLKLNQVNHLEQVLDEMSTRGIEFDIATFNILIRLKLMSKSYDEKEASNLFQQLIDSHLEPSHVTFNTFIKHACKHQHWNSLHHWLDEMDRFSKTPNLVTARILFHSFVQFPDEPHLANAFQRAATAIPRNDIERIYNAGISILINQNRIKEALDLLDPVFKRLPHPSIYSYNLLLKALCLERKLDSAEEVLKKMLRGGDPRIPRPDIVSFTTLIHGFIKYSDIIDFDTIRQLYMSMLDMGLKPNSILNSALLHGFIKSTKSAKSRKYIDLITVKRMFRLILDTPQQPDLPQHYIEKDVSEMIVYNTMMHFYFEYYHHHPKLKNSTPKEPFELLEEALVKKKLEPVTSTMNIFVHGLAVLNHDMDKAQKMIDLFSSKGVDVNEKTIYYMARSAYRRGKPQLTLQWISSYEKDHQIQGEGLKELKAMTEEKLHLISYDR
ncbi:hypothetical protein BDB01DRAFT_788074 [Pilobolus umbonatus]|nr:hypothetical protein BDB01DRAFT_788074 [Pilobolus umbonatus]